MNLNFSRKCKTCYYFELNDDNPYSKAGRCDPRGVTREDSDACPEYRHEYEPGILDFVR